MAPLRRELERTELFDQPDTPRAELAQCLADIARINRLGPIRTLLAYIAPFFERHRGPEPLRVLDVGTGGGDIPVAIAQWAHRRGYRVSVVALDVRPEVLGHAATVTRDHREIRLVAGEAVSPPVRPGAVDVAICSLMLHHLPEAAVGRLLRLMASVARLGFVVSDVRRSRGAYAAAWLLAHVLSKNRLFRHDGPLSVRRAYTRAELVRLSAAAGLPTVRWRAAIAFRVVGVYEREPARGGQRGRVAPIAAT